MITVKSTGLTDTGKKRKNNEDSLLVDPALNLYIVADGMGGHRAGEVASRMVVTTVQAYLKQFDEDKEAEELPDTDARFTQQANRLLAGIQLANRSVFHTSSNNLAYQGMGATVSTLYFSDATYIAANVGDSPIYLIRNNSIELISVLHTVMAEQEAILPKGAQKLGPEFRHMITRGMGLKETVEADICEQPCLVDDIFVICSDGLSDMVSSEDILNIAVNEQPSGACRSLVDLANSRGGEDNITVIVLKIMKVKPDGGDGEGIISRTVKAIGSLFEQE